MSVWAVPGRFIQSLPVPYGAYIYIKANMVVSVCVDKNWAMHGRFF